MDILFSITISILAVEYFSYLPVAKIGRHLLTYLKTAVRVVTSSRISDHWKERVLIRYATEIIKDTAYLLLILLGLLLLIVVSSLLFGWLAGGELIVKDVLAQPGNWVLMTLVASIYLYIRNRYVRS